MVFGAATLYLDNSFVTAKTLTLLDSSTKGVISSRLSLNKKFEP